MVKTLLLLAILTALCVLIGRAAGGTVGMLVGLGFGFLLCLGFYWISDRIALAMTGARATSLDDAPELHRLVAPLALQAGLPSPRLFVIESEAANAFAVGRDPAHAAVAVTTGLMRVLLPDELAGVLAHELAHIGNRDTLVATVVAVVAGTILLIARMPQWTLPRCGIGRRKVRDVYDEGLAGLAAGILMFFLAPLAAAVIHLAIPRRREFEADATGARIFGDPLPLADALEKLEHANRSRPMQVNPAVAHQFTVRPLGSGRLLSLFNTHPSTAERVNRLRQLALQPMTYVGR